VLKNPASRHIGETMKKDTLKLFRVSIKAIGRYKNSYVVATNTDTAYKLIKNFLDSKDLCFSKDRELESIELLAEAYEYPDCGINLFLDIVTTL
jgi:hypothetical protein